MRDYGEVADDAADQWFDVHPRSAVLSDILWGEPVDVSAAEWREAGWWDDDLLVCRSNLAIVHDGRSDLADGVAGRVRGFKVDYCEG